MTTSETTTMRAKTEVILERYPYRFVQKGLLENNGAPDFRIQKFNDIQKRYYDMYYLDSAAQLDCCIEDPEYVKWLDPDPCLLYTSPSPRDED